MGCLLLPLLLVLLALADAAIVRMLRRRQVGAGWWTALSAAWLAGAALGVWSGFFFEYRPSARLRVLGAPVPAAFFHWEGPPGEEQWVDFITPVSRARDFPEKRLSGTAWDSPTCDARIIKRPLEQRRR